MIGGINPWISIWTDPRSTIKAIVKTNPKFQVFYLASLYALESNLAFASYWSLGLSFPFYVILLGALALSPIVGWIWLYLTGWILSFTGKWVGGHAPSSHLRAAVAWAKIPSCASLLMWLALLLSNAEMTFIHVRSGPFYVFMGLISLILSIWSFVLLVQSVREVQKLSLGRSLINVICTWFISSLIVFVLFLFVSYAYSMS